MSDTRQDEMNREVGEAFVDFCRENQLDDDIEEWGENDEQAWFAIADAIIAKYNSK